MEMTSIITMSITCALIFLGLIKKNSILLFSIQMIWMYVLAAGNTMSIDMGVNEAIYNYADFNGNIYNFLCAMGKLYGLNYVEFNAVICLFSYGLIFFIIKYYSPNPCFVMSLLFFYPFLDMVIQKRWLIATSFIVFSLPYLLKNTWKSRCIFLVIIIFTAFNIHAAAIGYLLLIFFPVLKHIRQKSIVILVFIVIMIFFMPYFPNLLGKLSIIGEERVIMYFFILHEKIKYPVLNTILWSGFHMGWVFLFFKFMQCIDILNISKEKKCMLENLYYVNLLTMVIIPMYYWEPTFWRITRNILIYDYIAVSVFLPLNNTYSISSIKKSLLYLCYAVLAFFLIYFGASAGYGPIVEPIFSYNVIWEWL